MFPSFFTRLSSSVLRFSVQKYVVITFKVCEGQTVRTEQYVRLQRMKRIMLMRLKVPPAINQFNSTIDVFERIRGTKAYHDRGTA